MEFLEYETPIFCLRRLTQQDKSGDFNLCIKLDHEDTVSISTSVNKVRVISKKINNILEVDPTLNEYEINFPKGIPSSDIKNIIEKLLKSTEEKVLIEKEKEKEMNIIRLFLGETTSEDEINIGIRNIKEAISYIATEAHSSSIQFLSKNLKQLIENEEFDKLDESIAYEIIDSYCQQGNSQETLHQEIFEILKQKEKLDIIMHFLLQIQHDKLTEDMKKYIVDNLADDIAHNELSQIINQFKKLILNAKSKIKNEINIQFENDELNGIISYMKKTICEDLIEKGELKLSSGHPTSVGSLSNLIDYGKGIDNVFQNHAGSRLNESEGWIQFDFGKRNIKLTSYTLRSSQFGQNGEYHPKSWRILGSNDEKEWFLLDKRINDSNLNGKYKQHRFNCIQNDNNYYQFIRYIQDDGWYPNREYCMLFTCIEFFGSIINI